MVASDPRHIRGRRYLDMRESIVLRRHSVRGPRSFQRIQRRADRAIADSVNVQRESRQVEASDELEYHRPVVRQLTARDGALFGVETVRGHELPDGLWGAELCWLSTYLLAGCRTGVDITGDGQLAGRILAVNGLIVRTQRQGIRQRRRDGVGVAFENPVGKQLDHIGAN